jgi:GlcNAc-P-P-Und epimerase
MKILITGGSGFIGTNLAEHYLSLGHEVLNIDIAPPRNSSHIDFWVCVDILNNEKLTDVVKKFNPDFCFHLAARTDLLGRSIEDYPENIDGVRNIIQALSQCHSIRASIFASSMLVCKLGHIPVKQDEYCPTTSYGHSKKIGEGLVRSLAPHNFNWVIVRPTSIWGPWFSSPYRDFFSMIQRGAYFHPMGHRILRSYGFVLNSVFQLEAIQKDFCSKLSGETIYLSDYQPLDILNWANLIQSDMGCKPIMQLPFLFFKIAAFIGDFLNYLGFKKFPLTSFRLNNLLTSAVYDTTPLSELSGRLPYTVKDGVRITNKWLKKN